MTHVRLAVICAATLLLASADASANLWDSMMDFRKPNIKIGQLELHPYYKLTGSYDDNIYKVRRDEADGTRHGCGVANSFAGGDPGTCSGGFRGSWITTNNVGLDLKLPLGNNTFKAGYDLRTDNYKTQPKANDSISQAVNGKWDYKGSRIKASVWDRYVNTADPPYNPNAPANGELVTRQNRWNNTVGLSAEYELLDQFSVETHGSVDRHKYRNPTLAASIDRWTTQWGLMMKYKVLPKTRVYIVGDRSNTRYTSGRDANHKDWELHVGVEGQLAPKVKGDFRTGFEHAAYDLDDTSAVTRDLRQTNTSWTSALSLTYNPAERCSVKLTGHSSVHEAVVGGNFYESRGASLEMSHAIRKLTITANGAFSIDKYSESVLTEANIGANVIGELVQKRDDNYIAGLKVAYQLQDWLGVHTSYGHSRRHSILTKQFNYKQNLTSVGLSAKF